MILKPCPFCGGVANVEREGTSRCSCIVACENCGCRLESNEHGAGYDWNRRVAIWPTNRILRGGSFPLDGGFLMCKSSDEDYTRHDDVGIRCAQEE
jgi:hypothetical protein